MGQDASEAPANDTAHSTAAAMAEAASPQTAVPLPAGFAAAAGGSDGGCFDSAPCEVPVTQFLQSPAAIRPVPAKAPVVAEAALAVAAAAAGQVPAGQVVMEVRVASLLAVSLQHLHYHTCCQWQ
jgi:hypothetical protein